MCYCKPIAVHFEVRGSTKVVVKVRKTQHLSSTVQTHYAGNRSNLNAVEKVRISHSDDVTSSVRLRNHGIRGRLEVSFFSVLTAMSAAACRMGSVRQDQGRQI